MTKIRFLLILLAFAASPCVFSQTLEILVGEENAQRLRSGENSISEVHTRSAPITLLPNHAVLHQYISDTINTLSPTIAVENLHLYKKPSTSGVWTESQRLALFNQLTAISTLAGIEYFSASRDTMRTFYETSEVIDAPGSQNPQADPVFSVLPATFTLFARQKDLTFGENIYRYDFTADRDIIFLAQENITPLNAGIVPAVGRNRLRAIFAVIDCGDSLLVYAVSLARVASVPGLTDRIGNSFGNRAEAVYKWFAAKADEIF